MKAPDGFNPLRWRCAEHGCYNEKLRPKIEIFAGCLPGKIAFTDIDGAVEINGFVLFLEFKSGMPTELGTGQRIFFENLTRLSRRIIVVLVAGDAESMEISHIRVARHGAFGPWEQADIDELKLRIRGWAIGARAQPRFAGRP